MRAVTRWQRGQTYGARPPGWWPARWPWWLGPRGPHDGKSVVIFVGGRRCEFVPVNWWGYRGHVYHGTLRPDAADLADRLVRMNLGASAARTLAVISGFEGGFDTIQTYDRAKFGWGFIQFTTTGGLPRLLQNVRTALPAVFEECFAARGIAVEREQITIRANGRTLKGVAAHNRLHDDPSLWTCFLRASHLPEVQDVQVRTAYESYYAHILAQTVPLGTREVALGALFAGNEYGRAVACDRAVNRGVGHAIRAFRIAAKRSGARGVEDAPAILQCLRALEAGDGWRLDALEAEILGPGRTPPGSPPDPR
jgi:hypothetical protein